MIDRLRAAPNFLAVIGASGSGKSSVVMAGLLPRLKAGALAGSADWDYIEQLKPGRRPLDELSIELAKRLHVSQSEIDQDLRMPSKLGLHRLAKQLTRTRLVIYIDQFEELFTQTETSEDRQLFVDGSRRPLMSPIVS
ncbi:MAG: hypothetical protein IPK17_21720 [Chloroflexi bacterium]|nr:hypothetical protein [Chloroflexota bacterium]